MNFTSNKWADSQIQPLLLSHFNEKQMSNALLFGLFSILYAQLKWEWNWIGCKFKENTHTNKACVNRHLFSIVGKYFSYLIETFDWFVFYLIFFSSMLKNSVLSIFNSLDRFDCTNMNKWSAWCSINNSIETVDLKSLSWCWLADRLNQLTSEVTYYFKWTNWSIRKHRIHIWYGFYAL